MVYEDGIERMGFGEAEFPELLREISHPPKQLFYKGDVKLFKKRCAAVVGSRSTTGYGRNMAVTMAGKLAEREVVVVSGLARGIDTCAHRGALKTGGATIAVLACGLDMCYPPENKGLKQEIEAKGLLVSEYPPGTEPRPYHFPLRNRIISGLSEMTLVVQARNTSGALITAELAAEQGREVCAVPGNIDSRYNMGSNKLIKDGARPIVNVSDVLEVMGIGGISRKEAAKVLSEMEIKIFSILEQQGEMTVDQLCQLLEKPPAYITSILTVMELKGVICTALGKISVANG